MYRGKENEDKQVEDEVMNLLKVAFFTMVYNDPLIRMGLKNFIGSGQTI